MKEGKSFKVYILYVRLNKEMFDDLKFMLPDHHKFLEGEDGYFTGFYAWSNHMAVITEFIENRKSAKKLYFMKIRKFYTNEEYKMFRSAHIEEKLDYYQFELSDSKLEDIAPVRLVSTKNEYVSTVEDGAEHMFNLFEIPDVDYSLFNDKIIRTLDYFGYNMLYDQNRTPRLGETEEEYQERIDWADNNRSYNVSYNGNIFREITNNKAMCLVRIFEPLFTGLPRRIKQKELYY